MGSHRGMLVLLLVGIGIMAVFMAVLPGCRSQTEAVDDSGVAYSCPDCNVVLVTFDALRADHLGAFGYTKDTSPRLDSFASEAYVFTNAMSQSGTTVPSFSSFFSGRFPYVDRTMQYVPRFGLKESERTLAEALKEHGYATGAVVGHEFTRSDWGMGQGFDTFDEERSHSELAERTAERAIKLVDSLPRPFFLWVHFRPPHAPYEATDADFAELYQGPREQPTVQDQDHAEVLAYFAEREQVAEYSLTGSRKSMTPSMVEQYQARYDGNIRRADQAFGSLLDHIDSSEHNDKTILFVSADHGESMGEHLLFDHNHLYQGILRVPLMVRLPSRSHKSFDHPVMNLDIFPSALRLVGAPPESQLRGRDLFQIQRIGYFQFAEYENMRAVKLGKYKLIQFHPKHGQHPGELWLYDLSKDPAESINLAQEKPDVAKRLAGVMRPLGWGSDSQLSETMEKLRALGYIE